MEISAPKGGPAVPTQNYGGGMQISGPSAAPAAKTQTMSAETESAFVNTMTYGPGGIVAGLFDTLGQSFGVIGDNTMVDALHSVGATGFGDYFARHRVPLRIGGEIVGLFIPGLIASKLLKAARAAREFGYFGEVVKNSKAADILLGNSAALSEGEDAIRAAAYKDGKSFGIWSGKDFATPAVNQAKQGYYASRIAETARQTAAFEATYRVMYNQSELLTPSDHSFTDEAAWDVGGLGIATAIDVAIGRAAVRKIIQGVGRVLKKEPISAFAPGIGDAAFPAGERGPGITQYASLSSDLKAAAHNGTDPVLGSNLANDQTIIKGKLAKQIVAMASDRHAVLPTAQLSEDQVKVVLSALDKNDTTLLYSTKLSQLPEGGAVEFYSGLDAKVNGAKQKIINIQLKMSKVDGLPPDDWNSAIDPTTGKVWDPAMPISARSARVQKAFPGFRQVPFDEGPPKIANSNGLSPETHAKLSEQLAKTQTELSGLISAGNETHFVIEGDGTWSPYRTRADNWLDTNSFDTIQRSTFKDTTAASGEPVDITRSKLSAEGLTLFDDFRLQGPQELNQNQWSAAYAMGSKFISTWRGVKNMSIPVTEKLDRFTLDGIAHLAVAKPESANSIVYGGKLNSLSDLQFAVVDKKYQEFVSLMNRAERKPKNAVAKLLYDRTKLSPEEIFQRLNLPTQVGRVHPLIEVFAQARIQGAKSLNELLGTASDLASRTAKTTQMDLLQAAMRDAAGVPGTKTTFETAGSMFLQKDVRPVFVASQNVPMLSRSDSEIFGRVEAARQIALERLNAVDPIAAPLVAGVIQHSIGHAAVSAVKDVMSLFEGILSGRGVVVPQDRIDEQVEALKAARLWAQDSDKQIQKVVDNQTRQVLLPAIHQILGPRNKADKIDFNRIEQAYRHGWDIDGIEFEQGKNGTVGKFKLDPTSTRNKKLAIQHFGEDVALDEDGKLTFEYMPDMSVTALQARAGTPLRVSKLAADTAKTISDLSIQSGVENNALRTALGVVPITLRKFHLPTPDLSSPGTYFVRNSASNVIGAYTGGTPTQNRSRAMAAAAKLREVHGEMHTAVSIDDVKRSHSVFDPTFLELTDYSDQLAKTHVGISGGAAKAEIDTTDTTIANMVQSLNEQFLAVGVRARAAIVAPQLNYAADAGATLGRTALKENNIFTRYQAAIFSRSPASPEGLLTRVYNGVESGLDTSLSFMNAYYSEALSKTLGNTEGEKGARTLKQLVKRQTSEQEFMQYNRSAGEWSPFKTTEDWLASTYPETTKWSARPIGARLSLISATMSLRFLDFGTPVLNLVGLATTMPAVIAALRPLKDENAAEHIFRTAAWGTRYGSGDTVTFSPVRAFATTIEKYWRGQLTGPMERAASLGYFEPEYASLTRILTDPRHGGKSSLERWVNAASKAADSSEILSRKLAWGMGYSIGKELHGFDDERNAFIFANNFMNETIGNYSPRNKPAMFQGAIGQPLGAFQTYMFNYYRRMYGYLERKDVASLAAGYAAQASLFGAQSVPGWGIVNKYMFSNYDESDNLATRLDRKLPPGVGELMLHGSLTGIPAIFGQDAPQFYTRGSVDMTQFPANPLDFERAPSIQFMANTMQLIYKTADNFMSAGGFSRQEQEEIFANFSTNRAIKNIAEAAAGVKTDRRGAFIENYTYDLMHVAASTIGTTTANTQRVISSFNSEQIVQMHQDNLRARLTDKTRSLIRGVDLSVPALQDAIQDYVNSGGNPAYFGEWLRNTTESATTPKDQAKLKELSTSGRWIEFLDMLSALQQNVPHN